MRIVEWRSKLFCAARIAHDHGIRTEFVNKAVFDQLPESSSEYKGGDVCLLSGTGAAAWKWTPSKPYYGNCDRDMPFLRGQDGLKTMSPPNSGSIFPQLVPRWALRMCSDMAGLTAIIVGLNHMRGPYAL